MVPASERAPEGGLGRLVVAGLAYAIVAPVGLLSVPIAALLLVSRPTTRTELMTAGAALGLSLWWLGMPGAPPEQFVRAFAVIATAVFVTNTIRGRSTFTHRALLAASVATLSIVVLFLALDSSWNELRWWVSHQTGLSARMLIGALSATRGASGDGALGVDLLQLEAWLQSVVRFTADFFAAIVVLQLLTGLALATAVYHQVATHPRGSQLGRFRDFRFSEHLGWAAVIPLIVVLVPRLAGAKVIAGNLLLVTGALYALRGVAVAAFGISVFGGAGFFLIAVTTVILILVLPAALATAVLVGVLDAGFDLRRRLVRARRPDQS